MSWWASSPERGDPLAEFWALVVEDAAEVPLAEPTRRAVLGGCIVSLSQLDRARVSLRLCLIWLTCISRLMLSRVSQIGESRRTIPRSSYGRRMGQRFRRGGAVLDYVAQSAEFAEEVAGLYAVDPPPLTRSQRCSK